MGGTIRALAVAFLAVAASTDAAAQEGSAPQTVRAVIDVARDLGADEPGVRRAAAAALAERWPDAAACAPALLEALGDEDAGVAEAARASIESLRLRALDDAGEWVASLAERKWSRRDETWFEPLAAELDTLGRARSHRDLLAVVGLAETDDRRRVAATLFAGPQLGIRLERSLSSVSGRLADHTLLARPARISAVLTAASVARRTTGVVPVDCDVAPDAFVAATGSESALVRAVAAELLGSLGPADAKLRGRIEHEMEVERRRKSPSAPVRLRLAMALGVQCARDRPDAKLPAAIRGDAALEAAFASGFCRYAGSESVIRWLDRPETAGGALERLAVLGRVPDAAIPPLRAALQGDIELTVLAAIVLRGSGRTSDDDLEGLWKRVAEFQTKEDARSAGACGLAAFVLTGGDEAWGSWLGASCETTRFFQGHLARTVDEALPWMSAFRAGLARHVPDVLARLERREEKERPLEPSDASPGRLDVPTALSALRPADLSWANPRNPFDPYGIVELAEQSQIAVLRTVEGLGRVPPELHAAIEGLRDGSSLRVRVAAARALRAARPK